MANFISKVGKTLSKIDIKKTLKTLAFALVLGTTMVETVGPVATAYAATPTPKPGANSLADIESSLGIDQASDPSDMLGNVVGLIGMLARVVGILLGVYGLYKLVVALKDQDANGITQGIVLLAVGIILTMFKTIVTAVFGI